MSKTHNPQHALCHKAPIRAATSLICCSRRALTASASLSVIVQCCSGSPAPRHSARTRAYSPQLLPSVCCGIQCGYRRGQVLVSHHCCRLSQASCCTQIAMASAMSGRRFCQQTIARMHSIVRIDECKPQKIAEVLLCLHQCASRLSYCYARDTHAVQFTVAADGVISSESLQ